MTTATNAATKIAHTILYQLGGRRFTAMTGASKFQVCANGLAFSLPSYLARSGINRVRVTLQSNDTYRVEFARLRGMELTPIIKHDCVYADELPSVFTASTGLFTVL